MFAFRNRRRAAAAFILAGIGSLVACSQDAIVVAPKTATAPAVPADTTRYRVQALDCTASVRLRAVSCTSSPATGATAARGDRIVGGQDIYVRLASTGTSYDAGTQILQSSVTVQNLMEYSIGTTDGATVTGVKVFFASDPVVTGGTGTVSLANATGVGTFTASSQAYFLYNEILAPYQISDPVTWQFAISGPVSTFSFTVYVAATTPDDSAPLRDRVWTGASSSAWPLGANWSGGSAPDSASTVVVPSDSLLASHTMPALSADARLTNLRVGFGSSLALGGYTLTAYGNVDAFGPVTAGTIVMRGTSSVLSGTVDALVVAGSTRLQRATAATSAVSVTGGTLTVKDQTLTIQIP